MSSSRFKNIIIVIFVILFSFIFVSCDKSQSGDNNFNNNQNNQPKETTINDTLKNVYNNIYSSLNKEVDGESFASSSGKTYYDEYICAGLTALSKVSEIENLELETIYSSREYTLEGLSGNYANKIEKLYVSNNKRNEINEIKIYILGAKSYYSETPLDSITYAYEINYNEKTNNIISFECKIEKSSATTFSSDANYYTFYYNTDSDDIITLSYYRTKNFDYNEGSFADIGTIIKNFKYSGYVISENKEYEKTNDIKDLENQERVVEDLKEFDAINEEVDSLQSESQKELENLGDVLLYILNSSDKKEFESRINSK